MSSCFSASQGCWGPPPPDTPGWGGSRLTQKNLPGPIVHFQRQKTIVATALRRGGFNPLPIEIIARRKVAPAFEPRNCGGWRIAQARETGAPSRTCKLLFGNLAVQILLLVPADRPVRQPEPIQGGRLSLPIQCRESTTLSGHTGLLRWTRIWAKSASSSDQNTTFQSRFILTTVMP